MIPGLTVDLDLTRERATVNRLAWEVALDRLELDLLMVERLLALLDPPSLDLWDLPDIDGPMPADLLPRAREIHRRQAEVLRAVADSLTANRRQHAFADKVTRTSHPGLVAAAYVDLSA